MVNETSRPDLIESLRTAQLAFGETDDQFARRIGVTRAMWSLVRRRKLEPGRRMMRGIIAAFPGMTEQMQAFLSPSEVSIHAPKH